MISTAVLLAAFTFPALLSTAGTALAQDDLTSVSDSADGLECITIDASNYPSLLEVDIILGFPEDLVELLLPDLPHQVASRGGIPTGADEPNGTWSLHYDASVPYAFLTGVTINPCSTGAGHIPDFDSDGGSLCDIDATAPIGTGELVYSLDTCTWGVIEYINDPCVEAYINLEFESPTLEPVHILFNGVDIVNEPLAAGSYSYEVTALLDPDYNDVYALIGVEGQTFFMIGDVDTCFFEEEEEEVEDTPEELAESCTYEFATPETGELLMSNDDCTWGVIEFIPGDCLSGDIRIEFESDVAEHVQIVVNGSDIINSYMAGGEHIFDVSEFLTPAYNDVYAYIGVEGQTFFMVGSLEPCDPSNSGIEIPEFKEVLETPEDLSFTDEIETLPTTGGKHQKLLFLALAITATGMMFRCGRIGVDRT